MKTMTNLESLVGPLAVLLVLDVEEAADLVLHGRDTAERGFGRTRSDRLFDVRHEPAGGRREKKKG